jgi:protein ImuB
MSLFLPSWPTDRLARRKDGAAPADSHIVARVGRNSSPLEGEVGNASALPGGGRRPQPDDVEVLPRAAPIPPPDRGLWPRPPSPSRGEGSFGKSDFSDSPFVTAITIGNRRLVAAASPAAVASGIAPGLPLADAQAYVPGLAIHETDPAGDAEWLHRLAEWCGRYSPWTSPDGVDGIVLDITGCAHLRGGEARLASEIVARICRLGFACRVAIADTAGAAWAVARFGGERVAIVAPGESRMALAQLPVAALRLPAASVAGLERLGLKRIGALYPMPREALAQRFGEALARRLDQALGAADAPMSPLRPVIARRARLSFAEPIATAEDLARAAAHLVEALCRGLAAEGVGARRLILACYRIDGAVEQAAIGTARPSRDARHLTRLLSARLAGLDPGLGIEDMVLTAPLAERLDAAQLEMRAASLAHRPSPSPPLKIEEPSPPLGGEGWVRGYRNGASSLRDKRETGVTPSPRPSPPNGGEGVSLVSGASSSLETSDGIALAALVDRLGNRLGLTNLRAVAPCESHLPERAVAILPALDTHRAGRSSWPEGVPRPVRLFAPPEPIEAMALVPDDPPVMFRWRRLLHRVRRADGPERIAEEWWRMPDPTRIADPTAIRDYYRVEDESGRRFWLFRAGLYLPDRSADWFLHGVFA